MAKKRKNVDVRFTRWPRIKLAGPRIEGTGGLDAEDDLRWTVLMPTLKVGAFDNRIWPTFDTQIWPTLSP
jgi:hypothetical protein